MRFSLKKNMLGSQNTVFQLAWGTSIPTKNTKSWEFKFPANNMRLRREVLKAGLKQCYSQVIRNRKKGKKIKIKNLKSDEICQNTLDFCSELDHGRVNEYVYYFLELYQTKTEVSPGLYRHFLVRKRATEDKLGGTNITNRADTTNPRPIRLRQGCGIWPN